MSDGEFLWLASGSYVLVFRKPTESWLGYFNIPSGASYLHATENDLWVGMFHWPKRPLLIRLDKRSITSIPRSQWVRDDIPDDEIEARVAKLSRREQMLLRFNSGNYAAALKLASDAEATEDLESRFIQAMCYGTAALHDFERCRTAYQRIAAEFPGSPWSDAAQTLIELDEQHYQRWLHETTLLLRFNYNRDGSLDSDERALMERDSKYTAEEQAFKDAERSRTVNALFRRYDTDDDKSISMEELRLILRAGRNNPMFPSLFRPRTPLDMPLFADSEIATDTTMMRLDLNKDWRLTREELIRAMNAQK